MKRLFAVLIWVFAWVGADAQPYKLLGGATALGGEWYQITKAAPYQRGVVWHTDKINLNEPFDLEFLMNFGDRDQNGSDGMVFILQNAGTDKLGATGRDLGFSGISPSLGVEFDTFQNNRTGGTGYGDPEFDHIAVISNGNGNHTTSHTLSAPVPALESGRNIEDGRDHLIRIVWNPAARELDVYFDCQKRVKLRKDLVADLFEGRTEVWWGISGSTGTAYNRHAVCVLPRMPFQATMTVCAGGSATLTSRVAIDNQYRWFPAEGLDNPAVRSPKVRPLRPTAYTVSYRNHCGQSVTDTVRVSIATSNLELGKDTTLCEGQTLTLSTNCQNATTVLWNDGTSNSSLTVNQPGQYWVTVREAGCVYQDTIQILYKENPRMTLGKDTAFCPGASLTLRPDALPTGVTIHWDDQTTRPEREVRQGGFYAATFTLNGCSVTDTVLVREKPVFRFDLGDERSFCWGETVCLKIPAGASPAVRFVWSNGSVADSMTVLRAGIFWLESRQSGCVYRDSVAVRLAACQEANVYIPDVFTPNGDGVNDVLTLHYAGIDSYEFFVYDRWGGVLYKGEMNKPAWDGQKYPSGLYTWVVRYQFTDQQQQKHEVRKMGQVQLWR